MPTTANPSEQIIELESMLVQFTRALTSAVESLDDAFEHRPGLKERPVIYQIPRMSVSVKLSLTVSEGKVKGFLSKTTEGTSQEFLSTINLDMVAVPRPAEAKDRELKLTTPRMVGEDVTILQMKLQAWFSASAPSMQVAVDGDFGQQSHDAVREFQRRAGLPVTGVVDTETRARLWKAVP